jgi:hypothetical protein
MYPDRALFTLMGATDMKKIIFITLVTFTLVMASSLQGYADRGWHGGHGGRFGVGILVDPWGPGWGWPYAPYPYYPYYQQPPVAVQSEPNVYVQPEAPTYWYYCANPEGYYPYVKQCPKGWMKVVPSSPPGE